MISRRSFLASSLAAAALTRAPAFASGPGAAIVLDTGSWLTKIGFAADEGPAGTFRSVVGRPRNRGLTMGKSVYVGDEALAKAALLTLKYPIDRGVIRYSPDIEALWHHAIYNVARVAPEEHHGLLLADGVPANTVQRQKATELAFEAFNFQRFYVASTAALALYASGRTTGVVVEVGDTFTGASCFREGRLIPASVKTCPVTGRRLTDLLRRLLVAKGNSLSTTAETDAVREAKEEFGYVSPSYATDLATPPPEIVRNMELPDARVIPVGVERFKCPEALFQPSIDGLDATGLDEVTYASVMACDTTLRHELFGNIVLAGGSTMFPGLAERLQAAVQSLAPTTAKVTVKAPPERGVSAFVGGSILASLSNMEPLWITREEYDAEGPAVVDRKCPR